jgi:hypothetical protein
MGLYKPRRNHALTGYIVRQSLRNRRITDVGFVIQQVTDAAKARRWRLYGPTRLVE